MAVSPTTIARHAITPGIYLAMLIVWEASVRIFNLPAWVLPTPGYRQRLAGLGAGAPVQQLRDAARNGRGLPTCAGPVGPARRRDRLHHDHTPDHLSDLARTAVHSQGGARAAGDLVAWHRELAEDCHRGPGLLLSDFGDVVAGFEAVPENMLDLMRSLRASEAVTFRRLRVPIATPHLFTGCKIAITFAVIGAVIGEFVAAQEGLGYLILISTAQSQTPLAFAAIILLTLISVVLFYAILLEKRLVTWTP